MKIVIFGGTFNPIHSGHISMIEDTLNELQAQKALVVVAKKPVHKSGKNLLADNHRFNTVKLACNDKMEACDIELKRKGKSYSIITLTALKEQFVNDELYFAMGSDMFYYFEKWFEYEKIAKLVTLCVTAREECELEKLKKHQQHLNRLGVKSIIINNTPIVISSTEIRIAMKNLNYDFLKKHLSKEVYCYLMKNICLI